jgi:hypothetical protein
MREQVNRLKRLLGEIRRRGVFKGVAAYSVVAWGASLAASDLLPAFGAPDWTVRAFVICAVVLGIPLAAALAWVYEISSSGIVRDRGPGHDAARPDRANTGNTTSCSVNDSVCVRVVDPTGPREQIFFNAFRIGRDETCELQLDDPLISRRHAEVRFDDGRWWIVDLQSRNGTRLDGQLVERAPLPPTCSVKLYEGGPALILEVRGPRRPPHGTPARASFRRSLVSPAWPRFIAAC